jgi:molecular chaperone DnaK (HSP70)
LADVHFTFSVFDAKRLIGRKFADAEVQADIKHFPFKVHSKDGKPYITVEYRGEEKEFVCTIHTVPIGADANLSLF